VAEVEEEDVALPEAAVVEWEVDLAWAEVSALVELRWDLLLELDSVL